MSTSVYWVWHAICSKGQCSIFHIQMWRLECIWLYCTWNWDSFMKCHKDVHKILSYNASDYFLKHYWLSSAFYFNMAVSAEIRTLCTLLAWFWELLCLSGSVLFILWMTVFLFVMSHLVVLQFSEQTDVLGTDSSPFAWLMITLLSMCVHCHDIVCINIRDGIYSSFEQQKSKIFLFEGYEYFDKCLRWRMGSKA